MQQPNIKNILLKINYDIKLARMNSEKKNTEKKCFEVLNEAQ